MTTTEGAPSRAVAELRAGLEELTALVASAGEEGLGRPRPEGWTGRQVLAHLADFEVIAGARVLVVLSLDRPSLPNYDQEDFTARFWRLESAGEALERLTVNRRATMRVLEALDLADWERVGVHPVRGEETLRRIVEMMARHQRGHLEQLRQAAGPDQPASASTAIQ